MAANPFAERNNDEIPIIFLFFIYRNHSDKGVQKFRACVKIYMCEIESGVPIKPVNLSLGDEGLACLGFRFKLKLMSMSMSKSMSMLVGRISTAM